MDVSAYTIPTEVPKADGTIEWDSTTTVLVEVRAGGQVGMGFAYGEKSAAGIIQRSLSPLLLGH